MSESRADGVQPAVPDKRDWPRTEFGTIDWEAAFEHVEHGLIAMVEQTSTPAGILACGMVIIRSLFARANDAEERVRYERQINDAMAASFDDDGAENGGDAERRRRVIELLREIKEFASNAPTSTSPASRPASTSPSNAAAKTTRPTPTKIPTFRPSRLSSRRFRACSTGASPRSVTASSPAALAARRRPTRSRLSSPSVSTRLSANSSHRR
jgi:hypothetical protein